MASSVRDDALALLRELATDRERGAAKARASTKSAPLTDEGSRAAVAIALVLGAAGVAVATTAAASGSRPLALVVGLAAFALSVLAGGLATVSGARDEKLAAEAAYERADAILGSASADEADPNPILESARPNEGDAPAIVGPARADEEAFRQELVGLMRQLDGLLALRSGGPAPDGGGQADQRQPVVTPVGPAVPSETQITLVRKSGGTGFWRVTKPRVEELRVGDVIEVQVAELRGKEVVVKLASPKAFGGPLKKVDLGSLIDIKKSDLHEIKEFRPSKSRPDDH